MVETSIPKKKNKLDSHSLPPRKKNKIKNKKRKNKKKRKKKKNPPPPSLGTRGIPTPALDSPRKIPISYRDKSLRKSDLGSVRSEGGTEGTE